MNFVDWILAIGFTVVMALLANFFLPNYGWILGTLAALALLFLAKRRRDEVTSGAISEISENQPTLKKE